jgi:predicted transcriptional regulator
MHVFVTGGPRRAAGWRRPVRRRHQSRLQSRLRQSRGARGSDRRGERRDRRAGGGAARQRPARSPPSPGPPGYPAGRPPRTIRCPSKDRSRGEPARSTRCSIWPHAVCGATVRWVHGMLAYVRRTTVKLPDELDARLRHEAQRRGSTIAEVTRAALEAHLGTGQRRRFDAAAAGRSGHADISERIEEILRAEVDSSR